MCHYLGGGLHGRQKRVKAQSESSKSVVNSVLISREMPVFPGFLEIIRVVIQILQIEYLRPQVTPGDYKKMIRFTENSMINQKRDKLRELEEMEQKMQQANNDLQEFTELTEV